MKIEYPNQHEKIISYRTGNSLVKITEKKINRGNNQNVNSHLQTLDGIVKAHEQSHMTALGPYASSVPGYDYVTGPDGKSYAGGGHIKVDLSSVPGNPEATLQKANTILFASMAPGSPSGADMNVAAKAMSLAMQAKKEINEKANSVNENRAGDIYEILHVYKLNMKNDNLESNQIVDFFA